MIACGKTEDQKLMTQLARSWMRSNNQRSLHALWAHLSVSSLYLWATGYSLFTCSTYLYILPITTCYNLDLLHMHAAEQTASRRSCWPVMYIDIIIWRCVLAVCCACAAKFRGQKLCYYIICTVIYSYQSLFFITIIYYRKILLDVQLSAIYRKTNHPNILLLFYVVAM